MTDTFFGIIFFPPPIYVHPKSRTIPRSPAGIRGEDCSPCRDGADGLPVDGDQLVQHDLGAGEDAV